MNETTYKVFITEDDLMYRKMLSYLFRSDTNIQFEVFEDGQSCLDNLALSPDLILLDYTLPDYTGEEMLKELKSRNPDLIVIILSGIDDVSLVNQLLELGAYDFISKDKFAKTRILNSIKHLKELIKLKKAVG